MPTYTALRGHVILRILHGTTQYTLVYALRFSASPGMPILVTTLQDGAMPRSQIIRMHSLHLQINTMCAARQPNPMDLAVALHTLVYMP